MEKAKRQAWRKTANREGKETANVEGKATGKQKNCKWRRQRDRQAEKLQMEKAKRQASRKTANGEGKETDKEKNSKWRKQRDRQEVLRNDDTQTHEKNVKRLCFLRTYIRLETWIFRYRYATHSFTATTVKRKLSRRKLHSRGFLQQHAVPHAGPCHVISNFYGNYTRKQHS